MPKYVVLLSVSKYVVGDIFKCIFDAPVLKVIRNEGR